MSKKNGKTPQLVIAADGKNVRINFDKKVEQLVLPADEAIRLTTLIRAQADVILDRNGLDSPL